MAIDLSERPVAQAKLVGGRLCLDFVNTVGGRRADPTPGKKGAGAGVVLRDKLNDYVDLLIWSGRTGLLTEAELQALMREGKRREADGAAVLARALALREAIYRIGKAVIDKRAPATADLEVLNTELA